MHGGTDLPAPLVADATSLWPLPIADAIGAFAHAEGAHERRDRVVEVFRAHLRVIAAIALAARVRAGPAPGGDGDEVRRLLGKLRKQPITDGEWVGLTRELARPWAKAAGHPVPALIELVLSREHAGLIDELLAMRKSETVAHGRTGDDDELAALLARRVPQLERLLRAAAPLWALRLACTRPGGDGRDAWSLAGDTPPRGRWTRVRLVEAVAADELVLIDGDGRVVLALHPVMQLRRPSDGATEELFVLDHLRRGQAVLIALPSLAERRDPAIARALDEALGGDSGDDDAGPAGINRPYRGLARFERQHAAVFCGRDAVAESLANRIRAHGLVTVTGASGAGKSSLVAAGVLPRLGDAVAIELRPGADPEYLLARRLADALGDAALDDAILGLLAERPDDLGRWVDRRWRAAHGEAPLVIVIDQAEELITLGDDPARRIRVGRAIGSLGDDALATRVVIVVREDFFARVASLEGLRGRAAREVEVVTTPDRAGLRAALEGPAVAFGYQLEDPALLDEMVGAVAGAAAALPLLEFCADALWERRDRTARRLTRAAYRAVGGVEGALAAHADAVIDGLAPAQQLAARRLLLHLVTAERTRAVVPRPTLVDGGGAEVLDRLLDARLVAAREAAAGGDATIELVHEALIARWARLAGWLDEESAQVRVRGRVEAMAAAWRRDGAPADQLLDDGPLLADAARLQDIGEPARGFVAASLARAARRRRVRRIAVGALAVLAAAATVGLVLAIAQRQRARDAEGAAEERSARLLEQTDALIVVRAAGLVDDDPTAALAWLEALSPARRASAEARALALTARQRGVAFAVFRDPGGDLEDLAISDDGKFVFSVSLRGEVRRWDVDARTVERIADDGSLGIATGVAGDWLVGLGKAGVWTWKLGRGVQLLGPASGTTLIASREGRFAIAGLGEHSWVGDVATDALIERPDGPSVVGAIRFELIGDLLLGSGGSTIEVWDLDGGWTGRIHEDREIGGFSRADGTWRMSFGSVVDATFLAGGRFVAVTHDDQLELLDARTGERLHSVAVDRPIQQLGTGPAPDSIVAFYGGGFATRAWRDGAWVEHDLARAEDTTEVRVIGSSIVRRTSTGTTFMWPVATSERVRDELVLPVEAGERLEVAPTGRRATSFSNEEIRVWDIAPRVGVSRRDLDLSWCLAIAIAPGGDAVAVTDEDRIAVLGRQGELRGIEDRLTRTLAWLDPTRLLAVAHDGIWLEGERIGAAARTSEAAVSPDRRHLVIADDAGNLTRWRLDDVPMQDARIQLPHPPARLAVRDDGTIVAGDADGIAVWPAGTTTVATLPSAGPDDLIDLDLVGDAIYLTRREAPVQRQSVAGGPAVTLGADDTASTVVAAFVDGRIAAGGVDGRTRIWGGDTTTPVAILVGDGTGIEDLAVDEGSVVTASAAGTVSVWSPGADEAIRLHGDGPIAWVDLDVASGTVAACGAQGAWRWDLGPVLALDDDGFRAWLAGEIVVHLDEGGRPVTPVRVIE